MQAKVLIVSLIIGVAVFMGPLNPTGFSGDDQALANFFKSCIDKEIEKCDAKLNLLTTSKSSNLQNYVTMKAQKAVFFNAEKEMLVKEMIEMQLEAKHYKVELFLNSRFHESDQYRKLTTNF